MTPATPAPLAAPEARVARIAAIMDELKCEEIVALDVREVAGFADFFLIATARSASQMRAVARKIYETLKAEGVRTAAPIEDESPRWTILDYGDVVVHIFEREARSLYQLEQVWGDAEEFPWQSKLSA